MAGDTAFVKDRFDFFEVVDFFLIHKYCFNGFSFGFIITTGKKQGSEDEEDEAIRHSLLSF